MTRTARTHHLARRTRTPRLGGVARSLIVLAALALTGLPVAAGAHTNDAIAQTGGATAMPLLGSGLGIEVMLDAQGNLATVALDTGGTGTFGATRAEPHRVSFVQEGGTTRVEVRAKGHKLSIEARDATLAALVGDGVWKADLFGTGDITMVPYTVGDDGSGAPTISVGPVSAPSDVTVDGPTYSSGTEGGEAKATAVLVFSSDGFTKKLKISVEVEPGEGAKLKITLSGKDRQILQGTLADLFPGSGTRTASATLCDGSTAQVTYAVEEGKLVVTGTTPTGADVKVNGDGRGFQVRFAGSKVRLHAKLHMLDDGTYELRVDAKGVGKCKEHTADPALTVDGTTVTAPPNDHDGMPVAPNATRKATRAADRGGTPLLQDGGGRHSGDGGGTSGKTDKQH